MTSGIILAGGNSWRLKPETEIPKPLLPIGNTTLLGLQIKWLLGKNFDKIFIVCSPEVANGLEEWIQTNPKIRTIIETSKKGTGGAVRLCLPHLAADKAFYVMNVDDILLESEPIDLLMKAEKYGSAVRVSKPKLQFGRIQSRGDLAVRFIEKPKLEFYVSCGHYGFSLNKLINGFEFPEDGNLEDKVLPLLAKQRRLGIEKYKGTWLTVSNFKDYIQVCERLFKSANG